MNFYFDGNMRRISKTNARRLHRDGVPVFICPVNFRPDNMFAPAVHMSTDDDFDKIVNRFEYYNCTNRETGRYASFYVNCEDGK